MSMGDSVWLTEWKRKSREVWTLDRDWYSTKLLADDRAHFAMDGIECRSVEYRRVEPAPGDSSAGEKE